MEVLVFDDMSRPAYAFIKVDACTGGVTNSCHIFFPISHNSSHESELKLNPWVRHSQETFQAKRIAPSKKRAYVPGSSFANFGRLLSIKRGRGRGPRWRESGVRGVAAPDDEDWEEDFPEGDSLER